MSLVCSFWSGALPEQTLVRLAKASITFEGIMTFVRLVNGLDCQCLCRGSFLTCEKCGEEVSLSYGSWPLRRASLSKCSCKHDPVF